ncbi:Uncharacterised protein [Vibrio cholerae]|nr:Uncharacterised protein [Vibrio cholerae]CSI69956.1 Uncharacterised protein [Vibrio cholerae]
MVAYWCKIVTKAWWHKMTYKWFRLVNLATLS